MGRSVRAALAAVLLTNPVAVAPAPPDHETARIARPGSAVTVEYLANAGMLLSAGDRAVLIDGLFGEGLPEYPVARPATRDSLERAIGRFGEIDAVLVTHVHRDHFDARAVALHLAANPGAHLVAPGQAVDTLRAGTERLGELLDRVHAVRLRPGETMRLELDGVHVRAVGLVHPPSRNDPVELVGYRVDLGGVRVAHVGDASPNPDDFEALGEVDLLLAPWWSLRGREGAWRMEASGARRVAAFHLSRKSTAKEIREGIVAGAPVEVLDEAKMLPWIAD